MQFLELRVKRYSEWDKTVAVSFAKELMEIITAKVLKGKSALERPQFLTRGSWCSASNFGHYKNEQNFQVFRAFLAINTYEIKHGRN